MKSDSALMLEGRGLVIGYGKEPDVIKGVSLRISVSSVLCLVGPNGAGKSTLLSALAGILRPREGEVFLSARRLQDIPVRERARRIGYLPQVVRPSIPYTVRELVALGRFPRSFGLGFETDLDEKAIDEAMELTNTSHLSKRLFSEISGGERQRALIASVLAGEPEVILLDEPTASLDIAHGADVFFALRNLARLGRAVGVVTHDLNLAGQFADEVALLANGRIAAFGPPGDVFSEERLGEAYGDRVLLVSQPGSDVPAVLPARKSELS